MDRLIERELVGKAQSGDEEAFRELVEANMQRVYRLALSFTNNHSEADEIAQETFIKAYRSLDNFRGQASFSTWIYRIAVNSSLSNRRKTGKRAVTGIDDEMTEQLPDTSNPSQEDLAIGSQTRVLIDRAMDCLTKQQRMVFVMKHLQQRTITEIAEALGCAEGTVKQQLFRAVRRVRAQLTPVLRKEVAR